eukprot:3817330-Pyramimonas_sp.AAC.1
MHQVKVQGDEDIRRIPTVHPWSATYVTARISDANAPEVMQEAGGRPCIWPKRTPTCSMLIGGRS